VSRALSAGIPPEHISLSSQEAVPPQVLRGLIEGGEGGKGGVEINCCSLKQLVLFGETASPAVKKRGCGVRFNPGKGSGGTGKTVQYRHLLFFISKELGNNPPSPW
jgi:diaminopimelate decarboxylase